MYKYCQYVPDNQQHIETCRSAHHHEAFAALKFDLESRVETTVAVLKAWYTLKIKANVLVNIGITACLEDDCHGSVSCKAQSCVCEFMILTLEVCTGCPQRSAATAWSCVAQHPAAETAFRYRARLRSVPLAGRMAAELYRVSIIDKASSQARGCPM